MAADLPPPPPPTRSLSRRALLQGAAALGVAGAAGGLGLAACGDDDGDGDGDGTGDGPAGTGGATPSLSLVTLLNPAASLAAGTEARLPLAVGDERGALVDDSPDELTFEVRTVGGQVVERALPVARRSDGLPQAYYPLVFTPPSAGNYLATTEVDGAALEAAFAVSPVAAITIPRPGQPFPSLSTPTTEAPGQVDPVCTREPACPLHDVDLATVLGTAPVALLVSTPAFCQQAICGPVLDVLLAARAEAPDVRFLHLEVYRTAAEVEAQGLEAPLSPAVEELGLPFEPCLFLIAADGTLARRVDVIFDQGELGERLAELTA
ncbi:MAG TPA: hypothetical protein VEW93_12055 [Acidimicrobiales bacterium]|nr:hypothetical protein [Acidimicrobiales bacterium]